MKNNNLKDNFVNKIKKAISGKAKDDIERKGPLKIVFVTGGVVSSLGKGIVASIAGGLLKTRGLNVKIKKIDPYLNVDPGTLSPIEHGEVFVTDDGAETDLDLGHYERLGGVKTEKNDYITSGLIYNTIIQKERRGDYLGQTVMVVPHVIKEFEEAILAGAENCDVLICEVGGTVGDIESLPILETARQMKQKFEENIIFVHVALLPFLKKAQEWKTKPIQHSMRTLLSYGIQPDLLLCRMERENEENWQQKLALLCNMKQESILPALDADSIYHAMINYEHDGVADRICKLLDLPNKKASNHLAYIEKFVAKLDNQKLDTIKIAVVGKYTSCKDAYKSLEESLVHGAIENNYHIDIDWIDAETLDIKKLDKYDGILVPGGFGQRAIEGKIKAIKFAHENNIPFFGICFGMQLAIIEALGKTLKGASSSEFGECKHPVIAKMEEWAQDDMIVKVRSGMGGTMRLGAYPCELEKGSLAQKIYGQSKIEERHRHRYEVNNHYLEYFKEAHLKVSGRCSGLVEIIERDDCNFFIAVQFHPELKSSIAKPHPLFVAFAKAAYEYRHKQNIKEKYKKESSKEQKSSSRKGKTLR